MLRNHTLRIVGKALLPAFLLVLLLMFRPFGAFCAGRGGFPATAPDGGGLMLPAPGPGLGKPFPLIPSARPPVSRRSKLDGRAIPGPYSAPDRNFPARPAQGDGSGPHRGNAPDARRRAPLRLDFERVIQACLYRDSRWLLPEQAEYQAGKTLGSLSPTFITGAMTVTAGVKPGRQTIINWSGLRHAVRKHAGKTSFDITLDLRQYTRPDEVTAQMAETANLLEAEAWTLLGVPTMAGGRSGLLRAAVAEARRQGRRVGGYVVGGTIPVVELDYLLVHAEDAGENMVRRAVSLAAKGGVPVILVAGSAQEPPGSGFAMGKTPAERRIMVMRASRAQKSGFAFAYPVFGPMSGRNRAYNALRDEFMLDTVRRGIRAHNAGSGAR